MTNLRGCSKADRQHAAGFTLIELMITVAIIGILAAVAYPAYTSSVIKGKRGEGRSALADLMQQQERYMTQTGCYGVQLSGACTPFSAGDSTVPFKTYSGNTLPTSAYRLGVRRCVTTPQPTMQECAEVFATPYTFADAKANELWMRSTGEKGCNGNDQSTCWK